jgi:hypothetical protein
MHVNYKTVPKIPGEKYRCEDDEEISVKIY